MTWIERLEGEFCCKTTQKQSSKTTLKYVLVLWGRQNTTFLKLGGWHLVGALLIYLAWALTCPYSVTGLALRLIGYGFLRSLVMVKSGPYPAWWWLFVISFLSWWITTGFSVKLCFIQCTDSPPCNSYYFQWDFLVVVNILLRLGKRCRLN